jgi:hypothetical protein
VSSESICTMCNLVCDNVHHTGRAHMKRLFDGPVGETEFEEREALMADMAHLRTEYTRYGVSNESQDVGGTGGVLFRERERLFLIQLSL